MRNTVLSPSPHQKTIITAAGPIYLRSHCSPLFIQELEPDSGMRAFTRLPEHEHALLLQIAEREDTMLTIAYTPAGTIVGHIALCPVDTWWQNLEAAYEIGLEVSSNWRQLGIAHQLMQLVFTETAYEEIIVLGMGLYWHWDMAGLGLSAFRYREMLERFCAAYGFTEYLTSEPNIRMHPANIFLARLGKNTEQALVKQFFACLLRSNTLPGL
ncbi:acetoin utilization protein AcuA [Ktedonobacter sp. SOSP1-52]|uniref:GNAT family N-acetyltransferase n=1 Tax=Ktedonobacter sp. SOSP1-52 TaxID=2778366 RepID=UPI001915D340|nr:GNAT family N-acetyltransferase [Ktedonobacter sp. SOSP1-52]GHO70821.1 acetoin utilization protein AcuA [Ktedonobacter sp. SOSP1-52]